MKKLLSWILYIYTATTVVLAAYLFYGFQTEAFFVISAEQADVITANFNKLIWMYQSCRAGA